MAASHTLDAMNVELLKLLVCPICLQQMEGRIVTCTKGHNVCEGCTEEVDKCPSCKSNFGGGRNFLAEEIAEKLLYPCVNVEAGCSVEVFKKYQETHNRRCSFRKYNCFRKEEDGCLWTGLRSQILQHFQKKHEEYVNIGDTLNVSLRNDVALPLVISAHGEIFCYNYKYNADTQTRVYCVQFIGPEERASDFRYQIEIELKTKIHKVMFSTITHSDLQDMEDIINSGECLELSNIIMRDYFKRSDKDKLKILKNCD